MSLRWVASGGQHHANLANPGGLFGSGSSPVGPVSNAPLRNGSTYAYGQNSNLRSPNVGGAGGFNGMVAGTALYTGSGWGASDNIIGFLDNNNAFQCECRRNASGQLFFTRNGTVISSLSSFTTPTNTWIYVEFKASFSTTGTGTCEVRINGVVQLTASGLTNATTTAKGFAAQFQSANVANSSLMDLYVLDQDNGTRNNNYLGDITVAEIYPNGPGVNAAWPVFQAPFTLTSVANASAGVTVYTGTITSGAANAWQGIYFIIAGFTNGANNGTFLCTASTATTITLANASGVAETHAATCSFQNPCQPGIHGGFVDGYATTNVGSRPPANGAEIQYISSNVTNQVTDFAHQQITLKPGQTIAAVVHMTWARKDDVGTRVIQQICLSNGVQESSAQLSLNTADTYYEDVIETDPNTANTWTQGGFNAATFGVLEVT